MLRDLLNFNGGGGGAQKKWTAKFPPDVLQDLAATKDKEKSLENFCMRAGRTGLKQPNGGSSSQCA